MCVPSPLPVKYSYHYGHYFFLSGRIMAITITKAIVILQGPHFSPWYGVTKCRLMVPSRLEPTTFASPGKWINHSTTTCLNIYFCRQNSLRVKLLTPFTPARATPDQRTSLEWIFTWYLLDVLDTCYDLQTDGLMKFVPVNTTVAFPVLW